jgi:hypothetical protein
VTMSQPGSSKQNGESTLLTVMLVVATVCMVTGVVLVSVWLHDFYGKFLWDFK